LPELLSDLPVVAGSIGGPPQPIQAEIICGALEQRALFEFREFVGEPFEIPFNLGLQVLGGNGDDERCLGCSLR
jgi:hypothetical protein